MITSGRGTEKILKKDDDIVIEIGTNMTTLLGNTLTMRCPFEGDSETRVQWTVDSQPVTFNKRVYMLADNALKIDDITFFDNGVYVCKVLNYNGYDTESSLLRISGMYCRVLSSCNWFVFNLLRLIHVRGLQNYFVNRMDSISVVRSCR